jgi:hypothetical protein
LPTLLDCPAAASTVSRAALAQLQDWLVRQQRFIRSEGNQQAALQQLLQRMRHNPDFPALSQAINAINHIGNADSERLQVLAEIILKDFHSPTSCSRGQHRQLQPVWRRSQHHVARHRHSGF